MRSAPQGPEQADFERIVPRVPAGATAAPAQGRADAAARISAAAVWMAAGLFLLIAVLLLWLLPRWMADPSPAVVAESPLPGSSGEAQVAAPATEAAAPVPARPDTLAWDDPVQLEARAAAQAARAQFDQQLALLQARGVQDWGGAPLAAAQAQATAGADAFSARDFPAAQVAYQAAAAAAAVLVGEIPRRLADALAAGAQALEAGDKAAAQQAFEQAQALEPGNPQAQRGLQRVASLDAVRAKMETARRLEQAGDIAGARAAWKEALALDADTQPAREALARLDAQSRDDAFGRALGEALDALDRGRYDVAEKQLARARTLRSTDPAVQQAAARLAEGRRVQKLATLEREATAKAAAEDWAGAVTDYRAALQLDPTVAFARDGLARAEPRAALAQHLQGFIDRPERLTTAAVASEANRALQQARQVGSPGPRLAAQIAALESALTAVSTPVNVTLSSDGSTEVTLYRQGTLGRFQTHSLQLKPGHYVVVGSRAGYHDVRKEFDVTADARGLRVDVRCEERL